LNPLIALRGLFRRPIPTEALPPKPVERRGEIRLHAEGSVDVLWFHDGQTAQTAAATVVNHSTSGVGLVLAPELPIGTLVWLIRSHSETVKAVVRHCERTEDNLWRVGVRLVREERRRTDRDAVSGEAELKWLGLDGHTLSLPVTVLDLSESGAGLSAAARPPVGQSVQLIGNQFDCVGVVRHCCDTGSGRFHLGLLFARPPHNRIREVTAGWID
jgi:hypothetical protein